MKRRTAVKCAAANDDDFEDLEFADVGKRARTSAVSRADNEEEAEAAVSKRSGKKEKEFAWMDSDDDNDDDEKDKSEERGEAASGEEAEDCEDVSASALDDASTFGHLVRLAPSLLKQLQKEAMEVADVAAAYRAIARVKFFDGELLEALNGTVSKLGADGKISEGLATDAAESLCILNAYNQLVFSAIAQSFKACLPTLNPVTRSRWLQAFSFFKHRQDKDFLQMLEVAPLQPSHLGYKVLRCRHFAQGSCALGALCTFSHDPRAPPDLAVEAGNPRSTVMLTQCQLHQGRGAYTSTPSYG
eukprot:TRINITY_DN21021_c0_g1_i2.p1 TRINITY_DN21021_c0_g1~~TRINITY_DN21021_c0_g1_i2.p1  ORF type:complete len:302 (-),score=53.68 TRINITY_DN21021_c0_g1_i2:157-1062(-)